MRTLNTAEIEATEAIAAGLKDRLWKLGMTEENRFAVRASILPGDSLDVTVWDNRTKEVIAGARIGAIVTISDAGKRLCYRTGLDLGDRVQRCKQND